jgi:two-component system sensor histidine kinase VicK
MSSVDQNLLSSEALLEVLMLSKSATAIYTTEDLIIQMANDAMIAFWGKDRSVIGMSVKTAIPELAGQPFIDLLRHVWHTGETYSVKDTCAHLKINGKLQTFYFDFEYQAIKKADGETYCILHTTTDVTANVLNSNIISGQSTREREFIEELAVSNQELASSNEKLTSINEEQQAVNEDLLRANEELLLTKNHLLVANNKLLESEHRFRAIVAQAPFGMSVLRGEDMVIEVANNIILNIWGRTAKETINKPHQEARPELRGQSINDWLDEVYRTGIRRVNTEIKVMLYDEIAGTREAIINSVYQPLKDSSGKVTGILLVLEEVTERVMHRREAERIQEMFNRAVKAAELGTFDLNPATGKFTGNNLLKSWFGLQPEDEIDLSKATDGIADEDRERVIREIQNALNPASGGNYDTEYTILNPQTHIPRIVRAKGRVTFDDQQQPVYFNGTLQDITERKLDENRKNDFIAMVSHELKTPLTSTKAYVQMLSAKAAKSGDYFTSGVLDKIDMQVNKMNTLIKGFLDVARIESGKIHLNQQVFGLHELLTEVVEEATLLTHSHDISIHDCEDVMVEADRDKIGQVINNFITNAIKYSPKGKRIVLSCKSDSHTVQISVKDEGIGIKPQDVDKLFERFYRVDSKHTKTISGFGIGLYLCAEIIRRHNGKIWVESETGHGSTFSFCLPLA